MAQTLHRDDICVTDCVSRILQFRMDRFADANHHRDWQLVIAPCWQHDFLDQARPDGVFGIAEGGGNETAMYSGFMRPIQSSMNFRALAMPVPSRVR